MKYAISIKIENTQFFIKGVNQQDRSISIEVEESEAKKFDTKAEAWDFVSLHYLKNKYQSIGVRQCKTK